MGIVTLEQLRAARPYFIVGAFVVAAIVTPPDVISQLLLAIPMCLLYELGLIFARLLPKRVEDDDEYRSPSDAQLDSELDRIDGKP
jgi:sec-independent protein translocase protein TatC